MYITHFCISDYDSTSRPDVFASADQQRMLNEVCMISMKNYVISIDALLTVFTI